MVGTMAFEQFVLSHEPAVRLGFFLAIFALMGLWEWLAPRRALTVSKAMRWGSNLGLVLLNTLMLRLLFPLAAVGVASYCVTQGWGLFNYFQLPFWPTVFASVIIMDGIIWAQHVLVHRVPLLWRIHRVHHADLDYDLTTGSRFHPLEIALSMLIKILAVVLLGPPVLAVIIFEVILSTAAMFNHGNIGLPKKVDHLLRWVLVTPDMHRVHHSVVPAETHSNFGFNLTWWDRLLGTYREQPSAGHLGMVIGVAGHTNIKEVDRLDGMLLMPFKADPPPTMPNGNSPQFHDKAP
jgi:sterol desaturase/sphingolipid hydroxylase (fatty acid hydroxylase superfamily)